MGGYKLDELIANNNSNDVMRNGNHGYWIVIISGSTLTVNPPPVNRLTRNAR